MFLVPVGPGRRTGKGKGRGGDIDQATLPSIWQLLGLIAASVLVVAILTAGPALFASRRPVCETLI